MTDKNRPFDGGPERDARETDPKMIRKEALINVFDRILEGGGWRETFGYVLGMTYEELSQRFAEDARTLDEGQLVALGFDERSVIMAKAMMTILRQAHTAMRIEFEEAARRAPRTPWKPGQPTVKTPAERYPATESRPRYRGPSGESADRGGRE